MSELPQDFWDKFSEIAENESKHLKHKFPITVDDVVLDSFEPIKKKSKLSKFVGDFCVVRTYEDRTVYLGMLIGVSPIYPKWMYKSDDKRKIRFQMVGDEPILFLFSEQRVVLGSSCYWKPIADMDDLIQVNNKDDLWYKTAEQKLRDDAENDRK